MSQKILNKIGLPSFVPLPLLSNGKYQTIMASCWPYSPHIPNAKQHVISLPDGDKIILIENRPTNWKSSQRIVMLVHGLAGSIHSRYMVNLTRLLLKQGFLVMRMALRGCIPEKKLAQHLYHGGRSEDPRAVLAWLKQFFPNSPVTQIGFSLGANILLKMAGEEATASHLRINNNLDSLIAVSPPLDLAASAQLLIHESNKAFDQYFIKCLLKHVKALHQAHPHLPKPHFPSSLNIYEFDELYTAPRSGFKSANEYYTACSAAQFMSGVSLPLFLLHAMDDPFVSAQAVLDIPAKDNFDILLTPQGGHVGWLGYTGKQFQYLWMNHAIAGWVQWFDSSHSRSLETIQN